ncbi:MAG TPA: tRNA (guanosine(37)-N1)-methyltransferase TrmD [Halanaerobiales bacterium]|nr:tRNA (guanosine(37)-N1)-methyltransferase TrmD [Halanaerobiales bacterium]
MNFDILTLFPEMFEGPFSTSILSRAREKKLININITNIRDYTEDKHNTTDEPPYGGGAGMVLKVNPIYKAWNDINAKNREKVHTVLLSPQGKTLNQEKVKELSSYNNLTLICGHYEGVDERVRKSIVDEEVSIGDYVLTGGELPAMVLVDAVSRMVDGVLGDEDSSKKDSFYEGLLEHPHYTRPREFENMKVPEVLLSGHHARIKRWRLKKALKRTLIRRPDLLEKKKLSKREKKLLKEVKQEIKGENNEQN